MKTDLIEYSEGNVTMEGYAAWDPSQEERRPAVIVCHAFGGLEDSERAAAVRLSEMGYLGFAADLYGKGKRASLGGDPQKLMGELTADRPMLLRRLMAAVEIVRGLPHVNPDSIAAMGFCFGGLCVLDIARSGTDIVKGVASLHGVFHKNGLPSKQINSKVLVLHGYADPHAKPDAMVGLCNELTEGKADWQMHAFGNVMHGFTHVGANAPERGVKFDEDANRRSWEMLGNFFEELF